ncbi:MAG: PHP domain-containing protein, partial [Verrucomicrobia bacterium]|nr:PHP domain-containing protein [Verrucomicrobiota bacterium]
MLAPGKSPPSSLASFPTPDGWLKVDFHLHTREDPKDFLDHSALELLHRAHALGFHAVAITLHDHVFENPEVLETARSLGILLIPAAEMRLEGADVVILNLTQEEAQRLSCLSDLETLRKKRGNSVLILAPHPFFVLGGSIGGKRLERYIHLFDAIEICHFYTRWLDRNRPAIRIAERFGKPLIATSDAHQLEAFGQHYSLVQAAPNAPPEAIFAAIRAGCVQLVSAPHSLCQFARHFWWIFAQHE